MGHALTPPSNLVVTTQGRTICVQGFSTAFGTMVAACESGKDGWEAIEFAGPFDEGTLQSEVNAVGGLTQWIAKFAARVNARLKMLFAGQAPVLAGGSLSERLINEINANWKLTIGPDGVPIFGPK